MFNLEDVQKIGASQEAFAKKMYAKIIRTKTLNKAL